MGGAGSGRSAGAHSALEARWLAELAAELDERRAAGVYRELKEIQGPQGATLQRDGRELVQFCSNNYLGLANDAEVVEAARDALGRFGMGAGASRLVAGSMELHHRLEEALARFKGSEAALIFPTGFMANLAVLTTFASGGVGGGRGAVGAREKGGARIVSDKLNHASLLDAARFSGAEDRTFPHRHYARAAALLAREDDDKGRRFLVSDSVFSMDGDVADLPALCAAAEGQEALVILDEAHATGVLGARGRGLVEAQGVEGRVAVTVGTLSKAFGGIGGFVCAGSAAIEMLVNGGRAFIYTTALPPACSAAALAALGIIESAEGARRRERVMALARHVRAALVEMGFDCGDSTTPIIPVILGSAGNALRAAALLEEMGLWVPAIRPPTVPPNTSRLRISLIATHTDSQVEQLLEGMRAVAVR